MQKEQQTKSDYSGWIVSNNFLKRALAIFGYSIMGQFVIAIIIIAVLGIISVIAPSTKEEYGEDRRDEHALEASDSDLYEQ